MRSAMLWRAVVLGAGVAVVATASPAAAQMPPSPEAAEIAACLCLGQAVAALSADMAGKQSFNDPTRGELARLDAQLQNARATMDVNDPQSVAQFRQLLERHDAILARSTSVTGDLSRVVERYNARVNEYNARCANRPRDPILLSQVQARLSCPPLY